jgi:class 3 adenylate cyclase
MGAAVHGAERKLVTVLFADVDEPVPGFDEPDPEDAGPALAGWVALVRAEVERFGGAVQQVLGRRIVAVFGLPRAREDDPERAVLAALAIRDAIWKADRDDPGRPTAIQLSVATGEVVVRRAGPGGVGPRVAGEPLATCARLQELGGPGAVLVSEVTAKATGHAISYGPARPGTTGHLHALAQREPTRGGWEPRPAMVGREAELRALADQLELTVRTRVPRLVTLLGPPGIGKSRLVAELSATASASAPAADRLRVTPPPSGGSLGYSVSALAGPIRAWAGVEDADPPARAGAVLDRVAEVLPEPAASWVAGHVGRLLGLPGGRPDGDRGGEAPTALRRLLYGIAAVRPLVLVVEDLHRADDALLELVQDLVDPDTTGPAGAVPLLVVATARPELLARRPRWGPGGHLLLTLGALSDTDTARLVEGLLAAHGLPAAVGPSLLDRIGGNPLFAEEWVRLLTDRGLLADGGDPVGGPLPTTVHAIIAARLDALPPDELTALRDAAVLGPVGWVGALAAVGGWDEAELGVCLTRLQSRELVRLRDRSRLTGQTELAFEHVLVREVAYGQVLRAERAEKHQLAATWLQTLPDGEEVTELLADHWRAALAFAGGPDAAKLAASARRALRNAGARAAGLGAHTTAARYYADAVELCPPGHPERPALLLRLGRARCQGEGRGGDVLAEARDALLAEGDAVSAAEAEMLLAELAFLKGRGGERAGHLERALALVADAPPSASKAAVLRGCMLHLAVASRHAEARQVATEVLGMAERLGLGDLRVDALGTIGLARVDGGDPGGVADLERALAIGRQLGTGGTILWYLNLAYARAALGELDAAGTALDEAEAAAARFGSTRRQRAIRLQRVACLYWAGRWDEAVAVVDGLEARVAGGDRHHLEWECRTWRGRIRLARDGVEAAAEDAAHALHLARQTADPQARNPTLAFRARTLLAAGRRQEAAALAAELLAGLGGSLLGPEVGADLGLVLAELGVPASELDRCGTPPSVWLAAARALVAGDPAGAAGLYDRIGSRPDAAEARLAAARSLAGRGRVADAAGQLRAATGFWREVGAGHLLREAAALEVDQAR